MKEEVEPLWIYGLLYYNNMAENKKSFLIYSDTIDNISHLTNEEKGILFQHLLEYVNDLNPILEDRLILTAWKPIETHLKRDLKKWEDKAPQRSEKARKAGLASAEKRRQLKATKRNSLVQNELKPTKSTVSVSVNVSDSVNDILLEKETKELFNYWLVYRKEIKKPIKSEKTLISLAKKIKQEGFEKSKEIINSSIENGWQGLFWDKQTDKNKKNDKEPTINRQTASVIESNSRGWERNRN